MRLILAVLAFVALGLDAGADSGVLLGVLPVWALPLIFGGASGAAQSLLARDPEQLGPAVQESTLNPWRSRNWQAATAMGQDRLLNTTPRSVERGTGPGGHDRLVGGEYSMSPEIVDLLARLRQLTLGGAGTNPEITGPVYPGDFSQSTQNRMPGPAPRQLTHRGAGRRG